MKRVLSKVQFNIKPTSSKMTLEGFLRKYKKALDATNWDLVEKSMREFRYGP